MIKADQKVTELVKDKFGRRMSLSKISPTMKNGIELDVGINSQNMGIFEKIYDEIKIFLQRSFKKE